jgi:hypothetical protein
MMEKLSNISIIVIFLVGSLINNYILSILGSLHVPTAQSLVSRGTVCVICSILGGFYFKEKIIPNSVKTQSFRFLLAGIGLWATVESYRYARASEIAIISRLDIPLLIIFGYLISLKTSLWQKLVSTFLIASIVASIWFFSDERTTSHGLALAALGTFALSMSYLLLNQTSRTESAAIVTLTPGLSCFTFGLCILLLTKQELVLSPVAILLTALSGVSMYSIYRIVRHLYRRFEFLRAQVIYVLIPIISIPIDIVGFGNHFTLSEYCTFLAISTAVVITCLLNESGDKPVKENKNEYNKVTA